MAGLYSKNSPAPIHRRSALQTSGGRGVNSARPPSLRCQARPLLPKRSRLTALHRPAKEARLASKESFTPLARSEPRYRNGLEPVAPFVVASCPAPPVNTRTDRHCLAADTAGLPPAIYLEHTPRLTRLKHLADRPGTGYHTGRMSPSPVIHVHHVSRSRRLTSCRMSQLPLGHSFRARVCEHDFAGQNTEAPQLPTGKGLSSAVWHRLRLRFLARAFAPFIVELFIVGFFVPSPSVVIRPGSPVTRQALPTPATLNEPRRAANPVGRFDYRLWA